MKNVEAKAKWGNGLKMGKIVQMGKMMQMGEKDAHFVEPYLT